MAGLSFPFWRGLALGGLGAGLLLVASAFAVMQLLPSPLQRFRAPLFSMELPAGWTCELEGNEFICRKGAPPYGVLAIIAMKYRGPDDTLTAYREHVAKPIMREDRDGTEHPSRVVSVGEINLAGNVWINALHEESEVRNYLTRYLATITPNAAVLVTFSAHRDRYEIERSDLETLMNTLIIYYRREQI
jgi:hypothetical protein